MNVHSILFVLVRPERRTDLSQAYDAAAGILSEKIGTTTGIEQLAANVWLMSANNALPFLAECVQRACDSGLSYKVLFLSEEEAKWYPA